MGQTLSPNDCLPQGVPCFCYTPGDAQRIADRLNYADSCEANLLAYKTFTEKELVDKPLIHDPTLVIGGLILTLGLGVMVGLALGR